eukprot:4919395-Amphidinium_carterae.1
MASQTSFVEEFSNATALAITHTEKQTCCAARLSMAAQQLAKIGNWHRSEHSCPSAAVWCYSRGVTQCVFEVRALYFLAPALLFVYVAADAVDGPPKRRACCKMRVSDRVKLMHGNPLRYLCGRSSLGFEVRCACLGHLWSRAHGSLLSHPSGTKRQARSTDKPVLCVRVNC